MATTYDLIDYYYVNVKQEDVPRVLETIERAGIGLHAVHAFPENGKVQLDVSPKEPAKLNELARREQWTLTGPKKAFVAASDEERTGVLSDLLGRLAKEKIPVTATSAIACEGCFHELFWVPQEHVDKVANLLGAKPPEMGAAGVEAPAPH